MSLSTTLQDLATAVGTDVKSLGAQIGPLGELTTTAKSSVVAAVNEVRQAVASATGIDDGTTGTTTTWSSSHIAASIAGHQPSWGSVTDKPPTFPPTIGSTASTAKAGDWAPSWADVTGKPPLSALATSTDAAHLTGTLPSAVLPPLAIKDTSVVASQAAMLALTAQRGDMAIRTDVSQTFVLTAEPATTLANWTALASPTSGIQTINGKSGSSVTLTKADLGLGNVDNTSDLAKPISTATQTALNAKAVIGTTAGTAQDAALIGNPSIDLVAIYNAAKA